MTDNQDTGLVLGILFCVVASLLVCSRPVSASSMLYKFVDQDGVIHLTNVPRDERYKAVRLLYSPLGATGSLRFDHLIRTAARQYKVDPLLVKAIINVESRFDAYAISRKGARGLMQLMPGTAEDMNVSEIHNPEDNIFGGTRYFKKMLDMFGGDVELSLAAYNAGPEPVKKVGRIPEIPETQDYVKKVLKQYRRYKQYGFSMVDR